MKIHVYAVLLITTFLISCGSPESDGKKAAQAFYECSETFNKDLDREIREYLANFSDYNFTTRVEARAKVDEILDKVSKEYEKNQRDATQLYHKLKNKYLSNYKDAAEFDYAYRAQREMYEGEELHGIPLTLEVDEMIRTIIPPKPGLETIKLDLVGRSWQDKPEGYFGQEKNTIKQGSVKNVEILSQTESKDVYNLHAIISIQDRLGSATYLLDADIRYLLGDADEWKIDQLGINSVDVERTGLFNKYITARLTQPWVDNQLDLTNNSDATLIVGGLFLADYPDGWHKFCVDIEPNSTERVGGMWSGIGNITQYEIDFVERK